MAIVAMARQVAALGDEISAEVARLLGYKFITKKEIEQKILDNGFPAEKLHKYDEVKPGFFASLAKDRDEYLYCLQTAILESAAEGNCVLIGRGSAFVLEELPNLVSFRFVSNYDVRLSRLENEFNWNEKQAKQRIEESDANRMGFHKNFFNIDPEDPTHYHMVVNSGKMDLQGAAAVIVSIVRAYITSEREEAGAKKIQELLLAQRLVNSLIFEHKVNINFLHAVVVDKKIVLQGISDSGACVEKALVLARKAYPEYAVESAVSVVQDFSSYK
ncbi:MAG: cytidylate kinase-like family protein [Treponemataceae bacterium]|nr:cytidylate kinase-like family protein [Treponemataceae bacterium]MDE5775301.1 cytidylate kinase-like family protein [Treponemataceae bacterium]MDE6719687.1 cytidylate kinase-like family protein [Treponemataceae bacterium]